jgi:hypothetical protein
MRRLPSWVIVVAVGALVALAAADAIRPNAEPAHTPATPVPGPELRGLLVVAGPDCSAAALRLPLLNEQAPPRPPDCGGVVWSPDGTLSATCTDGFTDIALADAQPFVHTRGCSPAWRPDGAVSFIRDGALVVARRHGQPDVFLTREALAQALASKLDEGRTYRLVDVAWHGTVAFFGIVAGSKPWQRAVIAYTPEGLTNVIPELGQDISDLRVSPNGNFIAFARSGAGRDLVVLDATGREVAFPRIANSRAVAWSPDEQWIAIATRTTTFIARTGTQNVIRQIPVGGDSLAWLP